MTRPTKLTKERQERICKAIRSGLAFERAAQFSGICPVTFFAWKKRGAKERTGIYARFLKAVKKAEVDSEAYNLQQIQKAAQGGQEADDTKTIKKTVKKYDPKLKKMVVVEEHTEQATTKKKSLPAWQAAAWRLERRYPDRYGKHIQPSSTEEKDPFDDWIEALNKAEKDFG